VRKTRPFDAMIGPVTGWRMNVGLAEWMDLHCAGYPGWELDLHTNKPHTAQHTIAHLVDRSAYDIAVEWDDLAKLHFHWSEMTVDSTVVFVRKGDLYVATFDFQTKAERDRFAARYKAVVS
jgi:hypothetical protein